MAGKERGKTYTPIATFPSSSSNKTYSVSADEQGNLSCSCPAWVFKKAGSIRTCKHVQAVERGDINKGNLAPPKSETVQATAREKGGSLADIFKRLKKDA